MKPEAIQALELDVQGLDMREIIKLTGLTYGTLGAILSRHRIEYWRLNYPERIEAITKAYEELHDVKKVARFLGYSHTMVSRIIHTKPSVSVTHDERDKVAKGFMRRCSKCLGITKCKPSTKCCDYCHSPF